jgi:hypothetical protein
MFELISFGIYIKAINKHQTVKLVFPCVFNNVINCPTFSLCVVTSKSA